MATLSIPRQLGFCLEEEADAVFLLQEIHLSDATLARTQWIILSPGHRFANWHSWNFGTLFEWFSSCVVCTATSTAQQAQGLWWPAKIPRHQLWNKFTLELSLSEHCLGDQSTSEHPPPWINTVNPTVNPWKLTYWAYSVPVPPPMPRLVSVGLRLVLVGGLVGRLASPPSKQLPPVSPPQSLSLQHPATHAPRCRSRCKIGVKIGVKVGVKSMAWHFFEFHSFHPPREASCANFAKTIKELKMG